MATPFQHMVHYPTRFTNLTRPKATSSNSSWWAPLFGVNSEPDYITKPGSELESTGSGTGSGGPRTRVEPGRFTEEKARELRRKTRETVAFHDVMYHSAIASKLVSDVEKS